MAYLRYMERRRICKDCYRESVRYGLTNWEDPSAREENTLKPMRNNSYPAREINRAPSSLYHSKSGIMIGHLHHLAPIYDDLRFHGMACNAFDALETRRLLRVSLGDSDDLPVGHLEPKPGLPDCIQINLVSGILQDLEPTNGLILDVYVTVVADTVDPHLRIVYVGVCLRCADDLVVVGYQVKHEPAVLRRFDVEHSYLRSPHWLLISV